MNIFYNISMPFYVSSFEDVKKIDFITRKIIKEQIRLDENEK